MDNGKADELLPLFAGQGIEFFGAVEFSNLLPLFDVRSVARLPAHPAAVIFCLFPYYLPGLLPVGGGRNLSRYAVLPDYHTVIGEKLAALCEGLKALHPQHSFVPFVDASPFHELKGALLAGLGVLGQNGQLINEKYGSYVFIGEIATDLPLPAHKHDIKFCESCGLCRKTCPTGALDRGGFHADGCRSQITQKKGELSPWEAAEVAAGKLVWGCDLCTDICPHNRHPLPTPIAEFSGETVQQLTADNINTLGKNRAYFFRGKAPLVRNLALIDDQ